MNAKLQQERAALRAAMDRVLAGTPLRAEPGALTQTAVAREAGLHRSRLVNVHTDLRDEFEARKKAQSSVSQNEANLREEITALKNTLAEVRAERDNWKATAQVFARGIQVLKAQLADAAKPAGRRISRLDDYRA